jgi:hypothetical protein
MLEKRKKCGRKWSWNCQIFTIAQQPQQAMASSLSTIHDHTEEKSQKVGLLWMSDHPEAEAST